MYLICQFLWHFLYMMYSYYQPCRFLFHYGAVVILIYPLPDLSELMSMPGVY